MIKNKLIVLLALILLLLSVCLCSCADKSEKVHVGMPYTDFMKVIEGKDCFQYCGYAFYETSRGTLMVVRFDSEYSAVEEVRSFKESKTNVTSKSFDSIRKGMTLWEVVEKIGLPYGTGTSGMTTLAFRADNGSSYVIYWDTTSQGNWTVQSVLCYLP